MKKENIEEILENIGSEGVPADVHKIAQEAFGDFTKTLPQRRQHILREYIMNSKITKLAAAAAIIIAVFAGLHFVGNPFGATVTFAEVIEPILNAKTIILDIIIGSDESGPFMHEIVVGSRIRRSLSNLPNLVQIIDLDGAKMLVLDTEGKTASYVNIEGKLRDRTHNYVEFLQQIVSRLKDNQDDVEKLGEQVIDGQKVIGFAAKGPNEDITIWADPKTGHPIRIELQMGQMSGVMKNFEFDVPVAESLVSMKVPAGYTEKKTNFDLSDATEQDFVESLRIWAKVLQDGTFPEAVGTEATMKHMPVLAQKLQQMNISEEEGMELAMKVARGMLFHQILEAQSNCHYAGAGVKLGDADKAIFWYRPKDSETYRVIYGDLSVKDVAPEDLPK